MPKQKRAKIEESSSADEAECSNCHKLSDELAKLRVRCEKAERKAEKMEAERDQMEAERDDVEAKFDALNEEYALYESTIEPFTDEQLKSSIGEFVVDATKTLTPDDLKAQLKKFEQIVEEANESFDDDTVQLFSLFAALRQPVQRDYFFYLIDAKKNSDHLNEEGQKYFQNVLALEWIRIILTICETAEFIFGENNCIGSQPGEKRRQLVIRTRTKKV